MSRIHRCTSVFMAKANTGRCSQKKEKTQWKKRVYRRAHDDEDDDDDQCSLVRRTSTTCRIHHRVTRSTVVNDLCRVLLLFSLDNEEFSFARSFARLSRPRHKSLNKYRFLSLSLSFVLTNCYCLAAIPAHLRRCLRLFLRRKSFDMINVPNERRTSPSACFPWNPVRVMIIDFEVCLGRR